MRISTRLTLAVAAASIVIVGAYGAWQMHDEANELSLAALDDTRLLATVVQVAVENALRDGQRADVDEVLRSLELRDASMDILIYDARHVLVSSSDNHVDTELARHAFSELVKADNSGSRILDRGAGDHVIAWAPLRQENGTPNGTVMVTKPFEELRRDLIETAWSTLISLLVLVVAISIVTWVLVEAYVRRPARSLQNSMHRARAGDLHGTVTHERDDELAALVAELDALLAELASTREHLSAEAESRRALEDGLRGIDKLVTVGQLSAGLAHEIGSPLQILEGRARALAKRTDLSADVVRNAEILVTQAERVTRIVDQLVGFSRRKPLHLIPLNLAEVARIVVEFMRTEAERRGVRIELTGGDEDLPHAMADNDQMQQVVLNLLTNALRASTRGTTISVRVGRAELEDPATHVKHGGLLIEVTDQGHGMTPEQLARSFEPFFTTWSDNGGSGLGLAVVKAIVTAHRGDIALQSAEHAGTTVTVRVPAAENA